MILQKYVEQARYFGPGSLTVIALTFVLFVVALFTKGFTHDLLLEAAIFLVSVKIIIMTYQNGVGVEAIRRQLDLILTEEKHLEALLLSLPSARNRTEDGSPGPNA